MKGALNMFKVYNKDNETTSVDIGLVSLLLTWTYSVYQLAH